MAILLGLSVWLTCGGWLALYGSRQGDPAVILAVTFSLAVTAGLGIWLAVWPVIERSMRTWRAGYRRAVLFAAVAIPGFMAVVTPIRLPYPEYPVTVTIRPISVDDRRALGQEVWFHDAALDTSAEPFEGLNAAALHGVSIDSGSWSGPGWTRVDGVWLASGPESGELRWTGTGTWRSVSLRFTSHPWSGGVEIRQGSNAVRKILTRESQRQVVVTLPMAPTGAYGLAWLTWCLANWICASFAILVLCALVGQWQPQRRTPLEISFWSVFCVVLIGQLLYLALFHPGLMSNDSIDQWTQGLLGPIHDYHPAIHTVLHRVASRVFGTPVVIVLLQQVAYAALVSLWVRALARMKAPAWALGLTVVFSAVWIVPGILNVTVWKDVPYSIGIVGLSYGLFRQYATQGRWLTTRVAFFGMLFALVGVLLLRHNGLLAATATLVALLLLPGGNWRRTAVLAAYAVVLVVIVRGPLYGLLEVRKTPRSFALQNQVHQMSALVASGADLGPETQAMLEAIQPLSSWGQRYYCYSLTPNYYNETFDRAAFDARMKPFLSDLVRLGKSHFGVLIDRQLCVTSYVWRILQPPDAYLYSYANRIDPNKHGLVIRSVNAEWTRTALETVRTSTTSSVPLHLIWRPATWLYLVLFGTALAALRGGRAGLLWLTVPVAANALSLLILTPSQSVRYAYSAHLIGTFLLAILTSGAVEEEEATPD